MWQHQKKQKQLKIDKHGKKKKRVISQQKNTKKNQTKENRHIHNNSKQYQQAKDEQILTDKGPLLAKYS